MYNETTTIVNVEQQGDDYALSMTAENIWIATEIVRRHEASDGIHYSQMVRKKLGSEGYEFEFDTGDVFTCSAANEYPTSESVSDTASGGGGGSPLIVRCTVSNNEYVLSEDWDTINEAFTEDGRPVLIEFTNPGTKSSYTVDTYCLVTEVRSIEESSEAKGGSGTTYDVVCTNLSDVDFNSKFIFSSSTSSGTLSCSESLPIGGGGGGGVLVVTDTEGTLDKTWTEIRDAMLSNGVIIVIPDDGVYAVQSIYIDTVYFVAASAGEWISETADGYPVLSE